MALDFPNSPTTGQTFSGPGNVTWSWDGVKWTSAVTGSPLAISGGGTGQTTALAALAALLPVALMLPYAGATAPSGWLMCAGQNVSRTTYAALYIAIGTTYGVGDGSTTFGLPDLRGRVLAGKDNMGGAAAGRLTSAGGGVDGATLGAAGGGQSITLGAANLPAHAHNVNINTGFVSNDHTHNYDHVHYLISSAPGDSVVYNVGSGGATGGAAGTTWKQAAASQSGTASQAGYGTSSGISANHTHNVSGATDVGPGTAAALPSVPPTMVTNYIIFAGA